MIQKQYDQLLEICKQTKAELADLSKDIDEADYTRILEIEKAQVLIDSIEQDIYAKNQDVYDTEIRNRYEQLYIVYETTKKEVEILENLLQNNGLDKGYPVRMNQDYDLSLGGGKTDEIFTSNPLPEPKRERLNLRLSTSSLNLERPLDSENNIDESRLGHLENMASMHGKQTSQTTQELDAEAEMEKSPIPVAPAIQQDPVPEAIPPEILPAVPVLAPTAPEMCSPLLKTEIKKQSQVNESNQSDKQATKLSEKKGHSPLTIFLNVIFYFILVFSIVFVILFGNRNPEATPRHLNGYSVMRVATGSMEPNIPINSLIVTKETNPNDLQVGDVVTYGRANNTTLTHRIYEIVENQTPQERGFVLKGDAYNEPDADVAPGQYIIGRVIFISYPFGRALAFFQDGFWFFLTFVVLILVILFVLQRKLKNLDKQSRKNLDTKTTENT